MLFRMKHIKLKIDCDSSMTNEMLKQVFDDFVTNLKKLNQLYHNYRMAIKKHLKKHFYQYFKNCQKQMVNNILLLLFERYPNGLFESQLKTYKY